MQAEMKAFINVQVSYLLQVPHYVGIHPEQYFLAWR